MICKFPQRQAGIYGLPGLSAKDQTQVELGNATMRASVRLIEACVQQGCPVFLESPSPVCCGSCQRCRLSASISVTVTSPVIIASLVSGGASALALLHGVHQCGQHCRNGASPKEGDAPAPSFCMCSCLGLLRLPKAAKGDACTSPAWQKPTPWQ